MDWATFAASTSVAAVLSGAISLGVARFDSRLERRVGARQADAAREADWALPHSSGVYWLLRNCGTADATDVHVELFGLATVTGQRLDWPAIPADSGEEIGLDRDTDSLDTPKVVITWTSRDGTRKTATRVPHGV